MADPSVTISDLHMDGKSVIGTVDFAGPGDARGSSSLYIYDATGDVVKSEELENEPIGQIFQHGVTYDLPEGKLADGDYSAWLFAWLTKEDPASGIVMTLAEAKEGVSFVVGRGRVYKSAEEAHIPDDKNTITLANVRLEGTWVAFDMVNAADHDVSVDHSIRVSTADATTFHEANGREVVHQKATQQGHYLLPEPIPDGSYSVFVSIGVEGALGTDFADLDFQAHAGALTVIP